MVEWGRAIPHSIFLVTQWFREFQISFPGNWEGKLTTEQYFMLGTNQSLQIIRPPSVTILIPTSGICETHSQAGLATNYEVICTKVFIRMRNGHCQSHYFSNSVNPCEFFLAKWLMILSFENTNYSFPNSQNHYFALEHQSRTL